MQDRTVAPAAATTLPADPAPGAPVVLPSGGRQVLLTPRQGTIALQIHRLLREQIVRGGLKPGQMLSEKDLAQAYGVSRTPVREAFGKLEEEGLISILPQRGSIVAPISPRAVAGSEFVREALECAAAAEAARRCTPAHAARLSDMIAAQHACRSEAAFFEADDAMHRELMVVAGQDAAWRIVDAAKAAIDRVRYVMMRHALKRKSVLAEHTRIIECVSAGDAAGAVEAMRRHLRGVFASTARAMEMHPDLFSGEADPSPTGRRRRPPRTVR
ncbi:MAG: GntR family transcriptional regulator [Rhodospirillales bacterium]|nr:GntR family transcriptional regulator [Rhodospirillales bacterium]